jgi:hypothetical protein
MARWGGTNVMRKYTDNRSLTLSDWQMRTLMIHPVRGKAIAQAQWRLGLFHWRRRGGSRHYHGNVEARFPRPPYQQHSLCQSIIAVTNWFFIVKKGLSGQSLENPPNSLKGGIISISSHTMMKIRLELQAGMPALPGVFLSSYTRLPNQTLLHPTSSALCPGERLPLVSNLLGCILPLLSKSSVDPDSVDPPIHSAGTKMLSSSWYICFPRPCI